MRKFTRILASLLVAMLLISAVAISALAAITDNENQLWLGNDSTIVTGLDHNGAKAGYDFQDGSSFGSNAVSAMSYSNIRGGLLSWSATYNGGTNKYVRMYNDGTAKTSAASIYWDWYGDRGKQGLGLMQHDYYVVDFEFGTDSYVVEGMYTVPSYLTDTGTWTKTLTSGSNTKTATSNGFAVYAEAVTDEDGTVHAVGDLYQDTYIIYASMDDALIKGWYLTSDAEGYAVYTEAAVTDGFKDNNGVVTAGARLTLADGTQVKYADLKLAYLNTMYLGFIFRAYDNKASENVNSSVNFLYFRYDETENQWYAGTTDGSENYPLSTKVGDWTHFTFVLKVDNSVNYVRKDDGTTDTKDYSYDDILAIDNGTHETYASYTLNVSDSLLYVYANGEHIGTKNLSSILKDTPETYKTANTASTGVASEMIDNLGVYVTRFQLDTKSTTAGNHYHYTKNSICVDNVATNLYVDGYTGPLATHMTSNPTAPIYDLTDIVYKPTYNVPAPNAAAGTVYSDAAATEQTAAFETASIKALDYAAANGGYAVINKRVKNYVVPEGFSGELHVKLVNGATLTLKEGQDFILSDEADENGYFTIRSPRNAEVEWFMTKDAAVADHTATLEEGDSIAYPNEIPTSAHTYAGENKVNTIVGWEWATAVDGEYTEFTPDTLTSDLVDAAKAAGGKIYVRAIYADVEGKFTVMKDGKTTVYVSAEANETVEGNGATIQYTANTLTADFDALTGAYTVTLYSNFVGSSTGAGTFFTVAAGEQATVDLNGFTIAYTHPTNKGAICFKIFENTTFNIYSSEAGGTIWLSGGQAFRLEATTNTIMENVTINIAEAANPAYDGDNLTVYCSVLLSSSSDLRIYEEDGDDLADSTYTPTKVVDGVTVYDMDRAPVINIEGGKYYRHVSYTYALITLRSAVTLNAKDADFVSAAGRFFATDSRYWSHVEATFENCFILAMSGGDLVELCKELDGDSKLHFEDCTVMAKFAWGGGIQAVRAYKYTFADKSTTTLYYDEAEPEGYTKKEATTLQPNANTAVTERLGIEATHSTGKITFSAGTKIKNGGALASFGAIDRTGTKYGIIRETLIVDRYANVIWDSATETLTATPTGWDTYLDNIVVPEETLPASLKMNISTNNGFLINVYLEKDATYGLSGLTKEGTQVIGGVEYDVYSTAAISPSNVDDVKFMLVLEFEDTEFSYAIYVSLLDYFTKALENAEAGSVEKALIINAANYCNKVYKYATGEEYAAYTDIVAEAEEGMIVTDFGDVVRNVTEEQTAIEEAAIVVTDGNIPMFAFKVKGEQVDVYATYAGLAGKSDPILCSAVEATDFNGNTATYYVIPDMKIYDMKATITLSLDAEGNSVILEYNLAAYIASEAGQKVEVDDALYSFALASYNYKTNE